MKTVLCSSAPRCYQLGSQFSRASCANSGCMGSCNLPNRTMRSPMRKRRLHCMTTCSFFVSDLPVKCSPFLATPLARSARVIEEAKFPWSTSFCSLPGQISGAPASEVLSQNASRDDIGVFVHRFLRAYMPWPQLRFSHPSSVLL